MTKEEKEIRERLYFWYLAFVIILFFASLLFDLYVRAV
jgi:hypothetical protein